MDILYILVFILFVIVFLLKRKVNKLVDLTKNIEQTLHKMQNNSIQINAIKEETPKVIIEEKLELVKTESIKETIVKKETYFENRVKDNISIQVKSNSEIINENISSKYSLFKDKLLKSNIINKSITYLKNWFTDGNTFVKIGILILFIGFAMLFKEAYTQGLISQYYPIEYRIISVAIFCIIVLYFSYKLINKNKTFALLLQAGSIGILYLTTFITFNMYHLISSYVAFSIFIVLLVFSTYMSLILNSKNLIIFSLIGGFIAPILSSTGSNNYISLFSFYALLNTAIFFISRIRSWRELNLIGFTFTFAITSLWAFNNGYEKEFFYNIEGFLIYFFLLYVFITIYYAKLQDYKLKNYVDSSLLFGVPTISFAMQTMLVKDYEYGLAFGSFILGIFYISIAYYLWKKHENKYSLLVESFLLISMIFLTLSIPFALDAQLSSISLIIEGAGIVWISLKQDQKYRRIFGLLVQFAGTCLLINELINIINIELVYPYNIVLIDDIRNAFNNELIHFNGLVLSGFLVMATLTFTAILLNQNKEKLYSYEKKLIPFLIYYGQGLLLFLLSANIDNNLMNIYNASYVLVMICLSLMFYVFTYKYYKCKELLYVSYSLLLPAMLICNFPGFYDPLIYGFFILWPLFFISYLYTLHLGKDFIISTVYYKNISLILHSISIVYMMFLFLWLGIWVLLLLSTILGYVFVKISNKFDSNDLSIMSLFLIPSMFISFVLSTYVHSNDVLALGNLSLEYMPISNIGIYLWPFAFFMSFYLINTIKFINEKISLYAHIIIYTIILFVLYEISLVLLSTIS